MEHKERTNKNKKMLKAMAAGACCLAVLAVGIIGSRFASNNKNDKTLPTEAVTVSTSAAEVQTIEHDVTMMRYSVSDVETRTPVSSLNKQEVYLSDAEREAIALPTIDPTEPEAPLSYEEGWKAAGVTLDGLTGYQAKYTGLYAAKQEKVTPSEKTVYLTFDDGPTSNTRIILDELDKYNVKATFFVYPGAKKLETVKELLAEIADRGHSIAIHSWSHKYDEIYKSVDTFLADMDRVARLIYETTGIRPCAYRFPGGSNNGRSKNVNHAILDEMERRGFVSFDWNSSTQDAEGKPFTASQLAQNAIKSFGSKQRVIVLAHDGAGQKNTPYAVGTIIRDATSKGYKFGVLDNSCQEMLFVKR